LNLEEDFNTKKDLVIVDCHEKQVEDEEFVGDYHHYMTLKKVLREAIEQNDNVIIYLIFS
jgi:hypothetical protein